MHFIKSYLLFRQPCDDTFNTSSFITLEVRCTGGKRINFALKGGYQGRCAAAVVSFNTKSAVSTIQTALTNNVSGGKAKEIENRRAKKRKLNMEHPAKKRRILKDVNKEQHDYGPTCSAPDLSQKEYVTAKEEFLKKLGTQLIDTR